MTEFLAQSAVGGGAALTYLLFIIAGLFVGGTWTAYKSGSRVGMIICGAIALVALVGAILWLIGSYN